MPINHTFYNAGGVVDTFSSVKKFILSKELLKEDYIEMNMLKREKEDKFNFQLITDKNQLINICLIIIKILYIIVTKKLKSTMNIII